MKSLLLDQVTCCADGSMSLKLRKIVELDGEILSNTPHRVMILADEAVDAVMMIVNEALAREGFEALPDDAVGRARAIRAAALKASGGKAAPAVDPAGDVQP